MVWSNGHLQAYGEYGTLKTEPVKIHLKDNAQPYAVHTARHAAKGQRGTPEDGEKRHHREGQPTQPTDWCAPMVPVLKTTSLYLCGSQKAKQGC